MKFHLAFSLFFTLFAFTISVGQNLDIEGNAKISEMELNNTADSVVVKLADGTLAVREVSSLSEFQILSISSDTIYLTNGGFVKLPDDTNAGWTSNTDTTSTSKYVGIGTSSPSFQLHVNGKFKSDGITESSDKRFKQNVVPLSNALEQVLALNGVSYQWKYDDKQFAGRGFDQRTHVGFIAQDVEQIIPEVVDTDTDGFKSVQYSHIVPILVEAIKQQQHLIDALNQKVEAITKMLQKGGIDEKRIELKARK